jgi:hypothetical protein
MNGKLVVRVGGGFMVIEEFIASYAEVELKKMQNIESNENKEDNSSKSKGGYSSTRKSPRIGASPRGGETFGKKAQTFK